MSHRVPRLYAPGSDADPRTDNEGAAACPFSKVDVERPKRDGLLKQGGAFVVQLDEKGALVIDIRTFSVDVTEVGL
jgi:hypothetical protein